MTTFNLRYSGPGQAWQILPIHRSEINLGRADGNDLVLPSALVSRQHARIYLQGDQVWLLDLNSSNGTFSNGQCLPPNQWIRLAPGQVIQIGEFYLCLDLVQDQAPLAPPYQAVPTTWQTPQPPVTPAYPPAAPAYPVAQPQAGPPLQVVPQPSAGRPRLLPWLIGGAVLLVLVVIFAAVQWVFKQNPPAAGPPVSPTATLAASQPTQVATDEPQKELASLPVQPGAAPVQDVNGTALSLPASSLPAGQSASLVSVQLGSQTLKKLTEVYRVDTPAYSISVGKSDAQGGAKLSFAAKSDAARVAVLIDGQYLGILDNPPQNGRLEVQAPAASQDPGNSGNPAPVNSSPVQFFVISPKTQTNLPDRPHSPGIALAGMQQQDQDGNSCVAEVWTLSHCWRNVEKTIYVFWKDDFPANLKDQEYLRVIDTIQSISQIMAAYVQKGITPAALSPSKPIYLVIQAGLSEPYYSPSSRTIYLDWGFVASAASSASSCTVSHELFHWIEHQKYYLIADYYSGPKAWWLDMAAEMGSFLLNPACIDRNLTTYGYVNTNSNVLGFQASAFTWDRGEQARYIQAQQVYISTCSGGSTCALSADGFIQSVNSGTFPINSGSAQSAYQGNAKDLGLYLLGAAPQTSRSDVAIPPSARSGQGYGDYLVLKGGQKAGFEFGMTNEQFTRKSDQEVQVTAAIQKGGVYPLWVANGKGSPLSRSEGLPGAPGVLKIETGTPYWISLDGAAPQFNDGSKALTIAPLSAKLGKGLARIVAVAPDGDKSFRASLSLADFSGDWTANISNQKATPLDCPDYSGGDLKPADDFFLQIFSGLGTYVLDPASTDGSHLIWQGTLPKGVTGDSEIKIQPDALVLTYHIDQPKSSTFRQLPGIPPVAGHGNPLPAPVLSLALPGLPLLALLARRRKIAWQRGLLLAAALACAAFLLAGCIGIYGTIDATYTFKKAEYVNPPADSAAPSAKPALTWKLSEGTVNIKLDYTIEVTSTDEKGIETTESKRCRLDMTGNAQGTIGADGLVPAPNLGN